jgi:hypothetical protein
MKEAIKESTDVRMEELRREFQMRATSAKTREKEVLFEALGDMAEAIQEHARVLDLLRMKLDEIRHVVGVHEG